MVSRKKVLLSFLDGSLVQCDDNDKYIYVISAYLHRTYIDIDSRSDVTLEFAQMKLDDAFAIRASYCNSNTKGIDRKIVCEIFKSNRHTDEVFVLTSSKQ